MAKNGSKSSVFRVVSLIDRDAAGIILPKWFASRFSGCTGEDSRETLLLLIPSLAPPGHS